MEQSNLKENCSICYGDIDELSRGDICCDNKCKQKVCKICLMNHVKSNFDNKFVIKYPKCLECDKRIPFNFVKKIINDEEIISGYTFNMRMVIAVRCQGCEEISSFMIDPVSFDERKTMYDKLNNEVFTKSQEFRIKFNDASKRFMNSKANGMELINLLKENNELLECMEDYFTFNDEDGEIPGFIKYIPDYERRAKMISDWLRSAKFVKTNCCSYYLCFLCQRDWHKGDDCDKFGDYDQNEVDLRQCPHCNLTIERTEGCSSITCYCGEYFCWDDVDPMSYEVVQSNDTSTIALDVGNNDQDINSIAVITADPQLPTASTPINMFESTLEPMKSVSSIVSEEITITLDIQPEVVPSVENTMHVTQLEISSIQ